MKLTLLTISPRPQPKSAPAATLAADFLARAHRYTPTDTLTLPTEAALLDRLDRQHARTPTHLILLDPRGKLLSSEAFAAHLGQLRDTGTQTVLAAIGPPDGWSPAILPRAHLLLALGPMTLPHDLARLLLAEQLYRALTILAGHPYHTGH